MAESRGLGDVYKRQVKISKIKKMKSLEESQVVELNFSKSIQIISMLVMAILVIMLTWSMGW